MEILFWSSLFFIGFTYFGYPLWLALRKRFYATSGAEKENIDRLPNISVVIAAFNEEDSIVNRVRDIGRQNYPQEKIQIIVVSDGSTDRTVDELHQLKFPNLDIIALPDNKGKAVALNAGVATATGELIVFTDARQTFQPDAIRQLSNDFLNPDIGCVSGELVFLQDGKGDIQQEMGAYWKYEKWIRKAESATGSVIGATGAIYAIRKNLYRPLPLGTLLDDVLTPMNIVMQGYRCVFNSHAVAYDVVSKNITQEWKRKVRTLAGNWQLLNIAPSLFIPWDNPVWGRFLAHKMFRLLVPFALVALLPASILSQGVVYSIAGLLQILIYTVGLAGWLWPATRGNRFVNLVYFFIVMNVAVVASFWRWIRGQCHSTWHATYPKGQKTLQ
ncbi:glycosyltransferase family 2 protein [Desulfobulbus alkaliphilus]|uniref:glycosyltransferase family 2 protein n=1 Tax=Desulfobulbus alkaliphilus TaxID=869814 RepID=UPI0019659A1D|nr:glycosyltransferase family 2 protein [Desulfobulbus alkaliphilus]MBM9538529.1 glycosyltransferase family 2 protein [Desulfobulbus alkaliphilus]